MRFLKELFKPSLKCARVGHVETECEYRVFVRPEIPGGWGSGVADSATLTRMECRRCRVVLSEGEISNRDPIHSLSMPSEDFEKFEADGILIRH